MSWAQRGIVDFVTNTDVQDAVSTGIFTLKSGQSIPANTDFITKSEANTKLNITAIGGTTTDFPTKNQFSASSSPTPIYLSMDFEYRGTTTPGVYTARLSESIGTQLTVSFGFVETDEFGQSQTSQTAVIPAGFIRSDEVHDTNRTGFNIQSYSPTSYNGKNIVLS